MIKKLSIFLFFVFFAGIQGFTSNSNVYNDTLNVTNDNAKQYIVLANKYVNISIDTSIIIAKKILEVSQDKEILNNANLILGNLYFLQLNHNNSIFYYKKALSYYKSIDDKQKIAYVLYKIGKIYHSWGMFDKSLEYSFLSVNLYKELKNDIQLGFLYNNIGLAYKGLNKPKLALEFYIKSYKLVHAKNDSSKIGLVANNLGSAYVNFEQYDSAKYYFDESIKYKKIFNDELGLAHTYGNYSEMYYKKGNYKKSLEYLQKVKYISERQNNILLKALVKSSLGKVYTKLKVYNLAEEYLNSALEYAGIISSIDVKLKVIKNFSNLYQETKNYKKANYYLNQYISIKDSTYSAADLKKIAELQLVYDSDKKQKENDILKQITKENTEKYNKIRYYLIIIIILVIIIVLIFYNRIRINIKKNKIIKEKTDNLKNANLKLLELNTHLKNKVDEQTEVMFKEIEDRKILEKELKQALNKEKKANLLKDKFLSNISHEIRTPLNAISGLASLLNIKVKDAEISEYISGIYQNSKRLLNLLNNIIDFSKIESSNLKLNIENINVYEVIDSVLQLYKFRINEKKLDLILDVNKSLNVLADHVYLSKILNEILDNAIRYTNSGAIKLSIGELNEKEIFIKVIDTGIGIDSYYLPQIFDSFSQEEDGYNKEFQGIGLGLSLSKKFVEMNNGRIEISSKKDKGTIVTIILPTDKTKIITKSKEPTLISDKLFKQKEFQIFLIEDDYFNRLMLETILDDIGIVTSAAGGDEALELIKNKHNSGEEFDIMIIDINLPDGWDGVNLMQNIKEKWPLYNEVIFIAQTAYANEEDKKRFFESGFNEYITKPIDREMLINMIKYRLMT